VALIDILDERFNTGPLNELLFVETSFSLSWISGDASHQQVRESVFLHVMMCTLFPSS